VAAMGGDLEVDRGVPALGVPKLRSFPTRGKKSQTPHGTLQCLGQGRDQGGGEKGHLLTNGRKKRVEKIRWGK